MHILISVVDIGDIVHDERYGRAGSVLPSHSIRHLKMMKAPTAQV